MIHPMCTGLSLVTLVLLALCSTSKATYTNWFKACNDYICFVSLVAAKYLAYTMMGDANNIKWIAYQSNLLPVIAAIAPVPSAVGRIMIRLN